MARVLKTLGIIALVIGIVFIPLDALIAKYSNSLKIESATSSPSKMSAADVVKYLDGYSTAFGSNKSDVQNELYKEWKRQTVENASGLSRILVGVAADLVRWIPHKIALIIIGIALLIASGFVGRISSSRRRSSSKASALIQKLRERWARLVSKRKLHEDTPLVKAACPHCGAPVAAGSVFCPRCGGKIKGLAPGGPLKRAGDL